MRLRKGCGRGFERGFSGVNYIWKQRA